MMSVYVSLLQSLDETINPTIVPAVEKWLDTASEKGFMELTTQLRTLTLAISLA